MAAVAQRSFAGGELSPALYGRDDQLKYQSGLKQALNYFIRKSGGVTSRNGMQYLSLTPPVTPTNEKSRLIRFVFNDDQTHLIAMNRQRIRIYYSDGTPVTIAGGANTWVISTAYAVGDTVVRYGAVWYCFRAHTSAATDEPSVGVNYPITWMLMTEKSAGVFYYEAAMPPGYLQEDDLPTVQYAQSADVMFLACRGAPPLSIKRYALTRWVVELTNFYASTPRPTYVSSVFTVGSSTVRYRVTQISRATLEESLPMFYGSIGIANIAGLGAAGSVIVTTSASHGKVAGDRVWIEGTGNSRLDNHEFTVASPSATTFVLAGRDGTEFVNFYGTSNAFVRGTEVVFLNATKPATSTPITINVVASGDGIEFDVYRMENGRYGYVGSTRTGTFVDDGILPNTSFNPPEHEPVFIEPGDYPGVVAFAQQRLIYANTDGEPEKTWMSRIGKYLNFSYSDPTQDDDSVQFVLASRKVNEVRHIVDLELPVLFTSSAEWILQGGGEASVVTPTAINAAPKANNGSATYPAPVVVDNDIVYVQARGTAVRKFKYNIESDGYKGADLTVYSDHLFDGYQIVAMDYQKEPNSIIWCVRSDGKLLALSYLPEHEIWGWTVCDTVGKVLDVCVVPNGDEDAVFLIVERVVNGNTIWCVEKLLARTDNITEPADVRMMDCHVAYDGRNQNPDLTLTLSQTTGWDADDYLVLTASSAAFNVGLVGTSRIRIWEAGGSFLDLYIEGYINETSMTVRSIDTGGNTFVVTPTQFRTGVPTSRWAILTNTITAAHLANYNGVKAILDGLPQVGVYYPNGSGVVSFGAYNFRDTIVVGLGYWCYFETLDVENPNGASIRGTAKGVNTVYLLLDKTAVGAYIGAAGGTLKAIQTKETTADPRALISQLVECKVTNTWVMQKRVRVESYGMPITILNIQPDYMFGG